MFQSWNLLQHQAQIKQVSKNSHSWPEQRWRSLGLIPSGPALVCPLPFWPDMSGRSGRDGGMGGKVAGQVVRSVKKLIELICKVLVASYQTRPALLCQVAGLFQPLPVCVLYLPNFDFHLPLYFLCFGLVAVPKSLSFFCFFVLAVLWGHH